LISEDGEVTKGKVFGSEKEWGLDLDEVKTPGDVKVRIRKAGVVSESEDGVVTVERKAGWTAKVANNEGSGSSTSINFNFDKPVTEFTAGNIKMTGSGSFKINQLSTSEDHKEWILSITVTKSGELYLSISGIYGFEDGNEIGPLIVKGDDPPGPVSDLTVVQTKTSDTEITLTWTNPTDADFDHVNISWIATSEPDAEPKQAGEVKGTSYTAEDLKPDTQYKFTVKAVDKAGNESDENSTTAITLSSPAAGVTIDIKDFKEGEFTLIGIDKDEILYWMDNKELTVRVDGLPDTGWTYEWALDNIIIKDANSNTLNWNSSWFSTSNEGIEHTFTVIATDSNNVPYSKSVTFKVVLSKGGGGVNK
jgi:hypothetical protein